MKQSWIVGTIMMWVFMVYIASIIEANNLMDASNTNLIEQLLTPPFTNYSNVFAAFASFVGDVAYYMITFIQIIFLWFPDIWTGIWIWVWYLVCVPIGVGIVFSIVTIMRGVNSG